jgi:hypothetical protein
MEWTIDRDFGRTMTFVGAGDTCWIYGYSEATGRCQSSWCPTLPRTATYSR